MIRYIQYLLLCLLGVGIISCTKKVDFSYDNRVNTGADAPSAIRLVNLRGANELMVNGERLTSFLAPDKEDAYGVDNTIGTIYFPSTGRMGLTCNIPQRFVNAQGLATDIRFATLNLKWHLDLTRSFTAKDDFNHPMDYYFTFFGGANDSLFAVPRSVSSPANPENFKIRLLNLSVNDYAVKGPMKLTWADGTTIPGIENVAPGTYSDYVEIPYGTYQFKVFTTDGKQVPGVGGSTLDLNIIDAHTGRMMLDGRQIYPNAVGLTDSKLTYSPFKTFQPGGVYTIAIGDLPNFKFPTGNPNGETVPAKYNAFRIISDAEPQNITYARLQAINVLPGKKLSIQIDGKALGDTLGFAVASAYGRYIRGTHTVKVSDHTGALLIEKSLSLSPADNQSIWIYQGADGKPAISVVANNLSSVYYTGAAEDGSYSNVQSEYPSWVRFMNFCPDLPEATFTRDNGQLFTDPLPAQHLLTGIPVIASPYVKLNTGFYNSFLAYASQQTVVPGDWLRNVAVIKGRQFIADPALYTDGLPGSEPGFYTVALVGYINAATPEAEKARMIIIKHNK
jgi:hypothetical protein